MHPLAAVLNTILVVNFDAVSPKNQETNDQQNDHQELEACDPFFIGHDSSLLIIIQISRNILKSLQRHLGDHVTLDVTLFGEELGAPICTSFGVIVIDVLKAVSNEQFKRVVVHCRKSGEFNVGKEESVCESFGVPILVVFFLRHSEHFSHFLTISIGDLKDFSGKISDFVEHWFDSSQHGQDTGPQPPLA